MPPKKDNEIMLHIENACIAYGPEVLFSNFTLSLAQGEMACISGDSGRGKTSLLNAVMGFVPLTQGSITVGEVLLSRNTIDAIRRQIAWIPQELALPVEWVKDMIRMPFELKANREATCTQEELFACFEQLGLDEELYNKRVGEISGGQRQRIMIAVAGLLRKPLIVVDEPTSALDAGSTDKVLAYFNCQASKGAAILAVSHDRAFAAGCDKIIHL